MKQQKNKYQASRAPRDPFRNVSAQAACLGNQAKGIYSTHRAHTDIYVHELFRWLSEDQRLRIQVIYNEGNCQDYQYRFLDETAQAQAHGLLRELGLDHETLNSVQSKYKIRWSKVVGKGESEEKRELYLWYVDYMLKKRAY